MAHRRHVPDAHPEPIRLRRPAVSQRRTDKTVAAIKPGAAGDLTTPDGAKLNDFVAWLQPKAGTYFPTELAYDGGLYVLTNNGILTRFDAKTGAQTYKARIGDGGDFTSSPWGYNGKIFCLNEEGKTFVIAPARNTSCWIPTTSTKWLWRPRPSLAIA